MGAEAERQHEEMPEQAVGTGPAPSLAAPLAASACHPALSPAGVIALQRSAGNSAVAGMLARRHVRPAPRPQAAKVLQRSETAEQDLLPPPTAVQWASDAFTVRFERTERDGGRFEFVLIYGGEHPFDGPGVDGKTARLSVMIGPAKLNARVTRNDANTVAVDLYGDGSKVVKLVDSAKIDERAFSKGREHDLSVVDRGRSVYASSVWVHDPQASASDIPVILPEEHPGSNPVSRVVDGATEITIDGDGDQHKELKLTIKATSMWEGTDDAAKTVRLQVLQLSTGELREVIFDLPKPASGGRLWPVVREVSDGKAPTRITLVTPIDTQFLEISPPGASGNSYGVSAAGTQSTVTLPAESGGLRQTVGAAPPTLIGNILAIDLALGAYGDRFRVTLEPLSDTKGVLSIATLSQGKTKGGLGAELQLSGAIRGGLVATGPTSAGIDLNGDGKADLTIYDALTTPTERSEPGGDGPPEANRDHKIRIVGGAVGGEKTFTFHVREGLSYPQSSDRALDHTAEASQTATDILGSQAKEGGSFEEQLDAYEMALMPLRRKAADDNVIPRETYDAWYALSLAMIKIRPQVADGVPAALQTDAIKHADRLVKALADGEHSWAATIMLAHSGPQLATALTAADWTPAFTNYRRVVTVLDKVLVERLKESKGEHAKETEQAELLSERRAMIGEMEDHKPVRVLAVFHPDEKFRTEQGYVGEIPLVLYAYKDDDEWHLRDVTNPHKPWDYTVDAKQGETTPPWRLLTELDDADHFPEGVIHYDVPGDRGGRIATTGGLTWKKFFTYLGLALGAAALALAAGPASVAVYASWAFAGSAVATAAAAGIDLAEKGKHGQLDAATVVIDLGLIASALMGVAALRAGQVVRGAVTAAEAGAPLAGEAAQLAVLYGRYYVPLRVGAFGADVVVLSAQAALQVDEIEHGHGTDEEKKRAKMLALAQLAGLAGLQVLQIKGELASLGPGRNLELYTPREGAPPQAIVAGKEPPGGIKFSQKDVAATTGDGSLTIEQLTESMKTGGWKGEPIDVVEFRDARGTISIDNRRLLAAQNAGLKEIPMRYHAPNEPFDVPQTRIDEGFKLDKNIRQVDGELVVGGTKGDIVYAKGTVPRTWEEAALFRTANQGNLKTPGGGKFPLWGRPEPPVVRPPAKAPTGTPDTPDVPTPKVTSEITTLTNANPEIQAADVLPEYTNGSGFSGAYNADTKDWIAVASGDASLTSGKPIKTVAQLGGHQAAESALIARTGVKDTSKNVGFVLIKQDEKVVRITWNSGVINARNFGDRAAPQQYRDAIKEAVAKTTGFTVVE